MGFRLLAKRDIDARKAQDLRRERDEGAKLAKTVDALRELKSEEEARIEKWRIQTMNETQKSLNEKILELESLASDIQKKRKEWEELMEPLDRQWFRYVKVENAKIEDGKSFLTSEQEKLNSQAQVLDEKAISLTRKEQKIADERTEMSRIFEVASEKLFEAEHTLESARGRSERILASAIERDKDSQERSEKVSRREKNIIMAQQDILRKEDELEKREMEVFIKELQFNSPVKK